MLGWLEPSRIGRLGRTRRRRYFYNICAKKVQYFLARIPCSRGPIRTRVCCTNKPPPRCKIRRPSLGHTQRLGRPRLCMQSLELDRPALTLFFKYCLKKRSRFRQKYLRVVDAMLCCWCARCRSRSVHSTLLYSTLPYPPLSTPSLSLRTHTKAGSGDASRPRRAACAGTRCGRSGERWARYAEANMTTGTPYDRPAAVLFLNECECAWNTSKQAADKKQRVCSAREPTGSEGQQGQPHAFHEI